MIVRFTLLLALLWLMIFPSVAPALTNPLGDDVFAALTSCVGFYRALEAIPPYKDTPANLEPLRSKAASTLRLAHQRAIEIQEFYRRSDINMEFLLKENIAFTQKGLAEDMHRLQEPSLALVGMIELLCEKVKRDEERVRTRKQP
jgi:hypothetical protein